MKGLCNNSLPALALKKMVQWKMTQVCTVTAELYGHPISHINGLPSSLVAVASKGIHVEK